MAYSNVSQASQDTGVFSDLLVIAHFELQWVLFILRLVISGFNPPWVPNPCLEDPQRTFRHDQKCLLITSKRLYGAWGSHAPYLRASEHLLEVLERHFQFLQKKKKISFSYIQRSYWTPPADSIFHRFQYLWGIWEPIPCGYQGPTCIKLKI